MNLSLLLLVPIITAIAIVCCKGLKQVRAVAFAGAAIQLVLAFVLLIAFWKERSSGNNDAMLFKEGYVWFASFNINYHVGVDGISVGMILLTAFVVLAGILVSWHTDNMPKEFFFLLIFLSAGAYGFFISLDLFMLS